MPNEELINYLKDYDNCIQYCLLTNNNKENNKEIQECLEDINSTYNQNGKYELCKKLEHVECPIIKKKSFHEFLKYVLKLIEFLYSIRTEHGNKYDDHIILLLGHIDIKKVFNIDLAELECIKYPGNNTAQLGFPNNLKKYLEIMKSLYKLRILKNTSLNGTLEEYAQFTEDFQPWSRTITTFLNIYGTKIVPEGGIPPIENIKKYGSFLKNKDKYILFFNELRETINNEIFYKYLHKIVSTPQQRKKSLQQIKKAKSYNLNNVIVRPKMPMLKRAVSAPKQTIKKRNSRTHSRSNNKLKKQRAKSATFNKSKKSKSKTKKAKSYS